MWFYQRLFWPIVTWKGHQFLDDITLFDKIVLVMFAEVSFNVSSLSVCEKAYRVRMDNNDEIVASLKKMLEELKELLDNELGPEWEKDSHSEPKIETVVTKG